MTIQHPRSHASLARQCLHEYTSGGGLLPVVQLHDEPYALWHTAQAAKDHSARLEKLVNAISDWDPFLTFLIIAMGARLENLVNLWLGSSVGSLTV